MFGFGKKRLSEDQAAELFVTVVLANANQSYPSFFERLDTELYGLDVLPGGERKTRAQRPHKGLNGRG
jgi:hypothetical protein